VNAETFMIRIPHTCKSEEDISLDTGISSKAKAMAILSSLVVFGNYCIKGTFLLSFISILY